jgi:hypothetical protein
MTANRKWAARRLGHIRLSLGNRCSICGSSDTLELHYTGPKDQRHHGLGTKGKAAFYTAAWRKGQLRLVCQPCHRIIHKAEQIKRKIEKQMHLDTSSSEPNPS